MPPRTFCRSSEASLNFMAGSQGPQEIQSDMILIQQRRLGAPFKPYFGLSGIPQPSTGVSFVLVENPSYSPLEPEAASG